MERRGFLIGAVATGLAGSARAAGAPTRIGYLSLTVAPDTNLIAFRDGMRERGYAEGRDFIIEARYADEQYDRLPALVTELIAAQVKLIVSAGPASLVFQNATSRLPVVFVFSGDPVEARFAASFARPDRNMTGVSLLQLAISAKRVELLKEIAPGLRRIAVIANPRHPGEPSELRATREAVEHLGLAMSVFEIAAPAEFEAAFDRAVQADCDGVVDFPEGLMLRHRQSLADFALRRGLPSIFGWKPFAEAGGLMSYGPNLHDGYARAAYYVDKMVKGAQIADLPIEQATRLELVINLKTAKALGLPVPAALLARADAVIE